MKNESISSGKKTVVFYGVTILLMSAILIAYIWQFTLITEKKFSIEKLEKQKLELQKQISQLELVYNRLSAVGRIESIAKNKLHMIYPSNVDTIVIQD